MGEKDVQQAGSEPEGEEKYSVAGNLIWKVLSMVATVAAAKAANTVARTGWSVVTGRPVPTKTDWDKDNAKNVIAYSAISAALFTGAKVAAERKAAEYYRQSSGHLPKAIAEPKLSRKEKKAKKAADKKLAKATKAAERGAERLHSSS